MPTGLAAGDNEIISAPEFQQNAFSESGYFRKSRWAGNYEVDVYKRQIWRILICEVPLCTPTEEDNIPVKPTVRRFLNMALYKA